MAATWLLLISLASTQSGHISGLASRDDTLYKELPESMEKLNAIVRGIYKGVYRFRGEFLLALGKLHEVVVDIQKDVTEIKTNMSDIPDIDKDAYQIQENVSTILHLLQTNYTCPQTAAASRQRKTRYYTNKTRKPCIANSQGNRAMPRNYILLYLL